MNYNLIKLRKEKGLTQEQLAGLVGVTKAHISRVESGTRVGSPLLISRLAKFFDVSMDTLFFTHSDDYKESKEV